MTIPRRAILSGLMLLAALPAGCASPTPVLYTLDAVPGATLPGPGPRVVVLRDIGLAPYLDRRQIVRSSSDYHIDLETNDWWGEPFAAMIGRILSNEIDQRLPGSEVYGESGAVSPTAEVTVAVNITRFDVDTSGNVLLVAQTGVSRIGDATRSRTSAQHITVPTASSSIVSQLAAMSTALGQLADALAAALSTT